MAIDETGLTKGLVRKLNALRKSVGDELAEEVFAKWLEREATSQAKEKPDPVAMKIVETLAGFENDPRFNLGNHGYTLRRANPPGSGRHPATVLKSSSSRGAVSVSSMRASRGAKQGGGGHWGK